MRRIALLFVLAFAPLLGWAQVAPAAGKPPGAAVACTDSGSHSSRACAGSRATSCAVMPPAVMSTGVVTVT